MENENTNSSSDMLLESTEQHHQEKRQEQRGDGRDGFSGDAGTPDNNSSAASGAMLAMNGTGEKRVVKSSETNSDTSSEQKAAAAAAVTALLGVGVAVGAAAAAAATSDGVGGNDLVSSQQQRCTRDGCVNNGDNSNSSGVVDKDLASSLQGLDVSPEGVGNTSGDGADTSHAAATVAAATAAAKVVSDNIAPAAASASVRYRQREASVAAVGACLVTSSVRRDGKLLVAMVGLPARGKSFVARSLARHLDWVGLKCRIFSVGEYRRKEVGVYQPATYFEPGGEGEKIRKRIAAEVLGEALEALRSDIDIAIYDASNITMQRRRWLSEVVAASGVHSQVVFIETICNDQKIVRRNIHAVGHTSPEYEEKAEDEAEQDFKARIESYKKVYQPLETSESVKFIKLIDVGSQMMTNLVTGYIPGRITLLCMNLHLAPRPIWLSRHGESEFNMQGRIGGNAPLTSAGHVYAQKLAEFMRKRYPPLSSANSVASNSSAKSGAEDAGGSDDLEDEELVVWTSTMLRTGQTVAPMTLEREVIKWSQLTEINAGLMDSLTYDYVESEMAQEFQARAKDKLRYRYPGGESYQDLFARLEPVLFEMLRQRSPLLVVGHQAILRVLYGYFTGKDPAECPTIHMPLHTAIKLTPKAYTCEEEWHHPLEECSHPVADIKHPTSDIHSA